MKNTANSLYEMLLQNMYISMWRMNKVNPILYSFFFEGVDVTPVTSELPRSEALSGLVVNTQTAVASGLCP